MRNGLVYRKQRNRILIYGPAALESSISYKYHNEMSHVGVENAICNILNNYWLPKVRSKVKKHIRSCLKCIAFTPNSGKLEGTLHSIPKGDVPFVTLHIDHLARASRSKYSKTQYIFLVVDAFTKYIKLYPAKSTNISKVIKCF